MPLKYLYPCNFCHALIFGSWVCEKCPYIKNKLQPIWLDVEPAYVQ